MKKSYKVYEIKGKLYPTIEEANFIKEVLENELEVKEVFVSIEEEDFNFVCHQKLIHTRSEQLNFHTMEVFETVEEADSASLKENTFMGKKGRVMNTYYSSKEINEGDNSVYYGFIVVKDLGTNIVTGEKEVVIFTPMENHAGKHSVINKKELSNYTKIKQDRYSRAKNEYYTPYEYISLKHA